MRLTGTSAYLFRHHAERPGWSGRTRADPPIWTACLVADVTAKVAPERGICAHGGHGQRPRLLTSSGGLCPLRESQSTGQRGPARAGSGNRAEHRDQDVVDEEADVLVGGLLAGLDEVLSE